MARSWVIWSLALAIAFLGSPLRGETKLEWKAKKGDAVEFSVERTSSMESQSSQGEFKGGGKSETAYKIEVADRKGDGDLELKVTYVSIKAKQEFRGEPWEFDSTKKEEGDETAKTIRELTAKPIAVKVSAGKIADVVGFPETQGEQGDRNLFRARMLAGRGALTRDLELILAAAVQGKGLEAGKEYKLARTEEESSKDGRGGRFFGRRDTDFAFKYKGEEKVGDQAAAAFALSAAPPPERTGGEAKDRPAPSRKAQGTAMVSLKDGMLLKLEASSESKSEGERDGQTFKFSSTSKIVIQRSTKKSF